mmetsp:Transcript_12863/g.16712  ORF Transcript_12863/g.16712 Transcript_12863/m.16712 type:complete len:259 (+) Transcript_12863:458-1234(+)|eukprot:CAMPEP_0204823126 /NCGR_PEP_ID=MMETSP1346-20131115/1245_1 /ASSEMBLY_ACC=CAM_ASM_000771 /TAXON_ID=215587 /ORGANISM="Aplanochytrium stocchinoi, Strain GSBS06" /LENGTH=258 /DNA_ID=CAMNT_0051949663 /DNA_START=405 /DNA_END=1181 /DNA_ORIENTATION=-
MTLSFKVFMSFLAEDGDASPILSKKCYDTWVSTRKGTLKQPQESFRRVLTAHVCGMDGRRPFPEDVENSLLKVLRKREVWECFRGTGVSIGIRGFRNIGCHEAKKRDACNPDAVEKKSRKISKKGLKRPRSGSNLSQQQPNAIKKPNMNFSTNVLPHVGMNNQMVDLQQLYTAQLMYGMGMGMTGSYLMPQNMIQYSIPIQAVQHPQASVSTSGTGDMSTQKMHGILRPSYIQVSNAMPYPQPPNNISAVAVSTSPMA